MTAAIRAEKPQCTICKRPASLTIQGESWCGAATCQHEIEDWLRSCPIEPAYSGRDY